VRAPVPEAAYRHCGVRGTLLLTAGISACGALLTLVLP
jgi:hypothetical protein